jgi:hypothetical protein
MKKFIFWYRIVTVLAHAIVDELVTNGINETHISVAE